MHQTNNKIFKILPASEATKCNCFIKFSYYRPIFIVADLTFVQQTMKPNVEFSKFCMWNAAIEMNAFYVKKLFPMEIGFSMKWKLKLSSYLNSLEYLHMCHQAIFISKYTFCVYINFVPANDDRVYFPIQFEKNAQRNGEKSRG